MQNLEQECKEKMPWNYSKAFSFLSFAVLPVLGPDIKVFDEHSLGAEYGRVVIEEHREPNVFSVPADLTGLLLVLLDHTAQLLYKLRTVPEICFFSFFDQTFAEFIVGMIV